MNVVALVIFLIAAVLFGVSGAITKSLVSWGLCALTVGFLALYLITGTRVHF